MGGAELALSSAQQVIVSTLITTYNDVCLVPESRVAAPQEGRHYPRPHAVRLVLAGRDHHQEEYPQTKICPPGGPTCADLYLSTIRNKTVGTIDIGDFMRMAKDDEDGEDVIEAWDV